MSPRVGARVGVPTYPHAPALSVHGCCPPHVHLFPSKRIPLSLPNEPRLTTCLERERIIKMELQLWMDGATTGVRGRLRPNGERVDPGTATTGRRCSEQELASQFFYMLQSSSQFSTTGVTFCCKAQPASHFCYNPRHFLLHPILFFATSIHG